MIEIRYCNIPGNTKIFELYDGFSGRILSECFAGLYNYDVFSGMNLEGSEKDLDDAKWMAYIAAEKSLIDHNNFKLF